jgi:type I restriction enzyme M protein
MMAIRSNFFYTRSVPCELWFFNRAKPDHLKDKVLMLDARNVYRKVTRKIYDFSPEQLQNLSAVIWLYRGESEKFIDLVGHYLQAILNEASTAIEPTQAFITNLDELLPKIDADDETSEAAGLFRSDWKAFSKSMTESSETWDATARDNAGLHAFAGLVAPLTETSRDLVKQIDQLYKFADKRAKEIGGKGMTKAVKELDALRKGAVDQLKQVRYFYRQAKWLQDRFPGAELCDVEGLVKLVNREEIAANDWSLTPGRYVGVAPEEEDDNFDFEEVLRDIHVELKGLNDEATILAAQIEKNFEELGI